MKHALDALNDPQLHLSKRAREALSIDELMGDDLIAACDKTRSAISGETQGESSHELAVRRLALLGVLENLESRAEVALLRSKESEKRAELLFLLGGIVVIALPLIIAVGAYMGIENPFEGLFGAITGAGFLALLLGPGRAIRSAAKDRTVLLLLPTVYFARVQTAVTAEELSNVANDLVSSITNL